MLSLTRALLGPAGPWPRPVLSRCCWLALGLVLFGAAPMGAAANAYFPGLTQVIGMGGIPLASPSTVMPGSDGTLHISAFGTWTNQDFSVDNGGANLGAGQNRNLAVTVTPNGPGQRSPRFTPARK